MTIGLQTYAVGGAALIGLATVLVTVVLIVSKRPHDSSTDSYDALKEHEGHQSTS